MGLYQFKEIKMVHLELTSKCNAACPMCARNLNGGPRRNHFPLTELSLSEIQKIFPREWLEKLNKIYLCGNLGDPTMCRDLVPILQYFRANNPNLILGMHTNGGARDKTFWQELARVVDYCRFGIDGLEDTNHLYRQNVSWDRLESNFRSFIEAGGRAEWDYLVFQHNQHQVEEARQKSQDWGFLKFNVKATSRFFSTHKQSLQEKVPVHNLRGEKTHDLRRTESPEFENQFYKEQEKIIRDFGSLESYWNHTQISCRVAVEKSVYIAATGHILPCCWVASDVDPIKALPEMHPLARLEVEHPESLRAINALFNSVENIVDGEFFQKNIPDSWQRKSLQEGKMKPCARTCGCGVQPFESQFL